MQTGAILEITHRVLAAISGIFILLSAIFGLVRGPRFRWITIPPLVALVLVVEVSFFGAQIVLRGIPPGWAAVDVGSALLVVALMVIAALIAWLRKSNPALPDRFAFRTPMPRLVLMTTAVVYMIFVSGVLVAGENPILGCLGWPIFSSTLFEIDTRDLGSTFRYILSVAGIIMVIGVLVHAWRIRRAQSDIYRIARWVGVAFLFEAMLQIVLLIFRSPVYLLVVYTVTAGLFWALLITLLARTSIEDKFP